MDPSNKNSQLREELADLDKNALQPEWDQILDPLLLDPISKAHIEYVEAQAKGKYKPLPLWLKLVLQELDVYDVDLSKVCYAEGINTLQEDNAITFGNNVHSPRPINIDWYDNGARDDVHWILHELEHVVQYKKLRGVTAFVNKYLVQAGVGSLEHLQKLGKSWTSFVNKVHNSMPIEIEAENKANEMIDTGMKARGNLSLGRQTPLGHSIGSRILLQNATMYGGDYLQSENSLYRFILQGDGNVVLYAPQNKVIWASYTDGMGKPPYRIVAQYDGNVVQYGGHNSPEHALWRTGTNGLGGRSSFFRMTVTWSFTPTETRPCGTRLNSQFEDFTLQHTYSSIRAPEESRGRRGILRILFPWFELLRLRDIVSGIRAVAQIFTRSKSLRSGSA